MDGDMAEPPPASRVEGSPPLIHPPQQERSRKTLENIVRAGRRLLLSRGPEALTVSELARQARTSVGAFYARFPGKEEMVRYLGERFLASALAAWEPPEPSEGDEAADDREAGAPSTLLEALEALAHDLARGEAALLLTLHGVDDPAPTRMARFDEAVARALVPLLVSSPGHQGRHAEDAHLQALGLVAATRALVRRAAASEAGEPSPARIAAALAGLGSGAASGASSSSSPTTGPDKADPPAVDVFDVWG